MCLHTVPIIDPLLSRERTRPRAAIDQFGSFQTLGFFWTSVKITAQHREKVHNEPIRKKTPQKRALV